MRSSFMIGVALAACALAAPAAAAEENIQIERLELHGSDSGIVRGWNAIGIDPFTGDVLKGGQVLSSSTSVRISEVQEAWQMRLRGDCQSYYLKNGDKLRTTFGANRSMPAEVNFSSASDAAERRADVCVVRPDGAAVVFLDGCGNISFAHAVVRKLIPERRAERPRPPVVVTTTIAPREPESSVSAPFLGWPITPSYVRGKTNVRVSGTAAVAAEAGADASGSAGCNTCGGGH